MSEFERNKFYGKKKYSSQRSDSSTYAGSRFFNNKLSYSKEESLKEDKDEKSKNIKQPTILLKNRDRYEDGSVSPKRNLKESEPAPNPITIVSPPATECNLGVVKNLTKSLKLIEDGVIFSENIQEYLLENNDFLVIGIIGGQASGKSTILNLLSQSNISEKFKKDLFNHKKLQDNRGSFDNIKILTENIINHNSDDCDKENMVFKVEQTCDIEANSNKTHGIDFYITKDRIIFLDTQPVMSASVLDELMRSETKRLNVISEFLRTENSGEIQSLQITTFLMSVCHVIIFMQDWFFDSNLIRFLQAAEMLRPTISNVEDELAEYFPHLILCHNKAQIDDFTPNRFKTMQQFYKNVFNKTKMHLNSGLGLGTGKIIPCLTPSNCGEPINLFLLPEFDAETDNLYKGHPPLEELIKKFRGNILGVTKLQLSHVQLSEKNWMVYCAKVWEHVRKSSFFVEYTKQIA